MTKSLLSLRKFAEALNCINESDVYTIESTALNYTIYKYHTKVLEQPLTQTGYIQGNEYFVHEISVYLKEGGWIEQET